jgi:predicted DNA-binding protein with PD1-like motif
MKNLDLAEGSLGRLFVMRLKPGMKLYETIETVLKEKNIEYAIIVNGVGAIEEAKIRNLVAYAEKFPIGDKERVHVNTKGPLELLSLQGSISRGKDGVFVHGHAVFCGVQPAGSAFGGHLVEAKVYSTTEVTIVEALDMQLLRAICPESGGLELKPVNE